MMCGAVNSFLGAAADVLGCGEASAAGELVVLGLAWPFELKARIQRAIAGARSVADDSLDA